MGENNILEAINMHNNGDSESVILEKTQLTQEKLRVLIIALKN